MTTQQKGFSIVEAVIVLVILGLIGGVGYAVYHRGHTTKNATNNTSQNTQSSAPVGSTQSIDNLTAQDQGAEDAIDAKHVNSNQSTVQTTDGAAANIGGAYDESSF